MTPWVFVGICLAGGAGAALRFTADAWIRSRVSMRFPFATAVINVTGSFVLGLVTGAAGSHLLPPAWFAVLGTGLLGGYTTFSTASVETVRLLAAREYRPALAAGLGVLVIGVLAALLGLWLGGLA
ncbi:camphor resistance protein CrcB [Raineyella antarctica]|uniref:Fluoride-specific ion channel FluC n=1 Tax=Raineyella antarctica TaxID=1577474 RepID=A0A1G6IKR0_9ACTN|nr:fluoride efflux transporter CrcB [Raineyella antarctica]SDC06346.1 camphor resistance protein CrcB [Raineyella antarctica]